VKGDKAAAVLRVEAGEKRVLHVCEPLLPLSQTFIQQRLVGRTFRPAVLCWTRSEPTLDVSCPIVFSPRPLRAWGTRRGLRRLAAVFDEWALRRSLVQLAPTVVHAHFGTVGLLVGKACAALGIPLVVSFYGIDATVAPGRPAVAAGYRRMFEQGAYAIAEAEGLGRRLAGLGARSARIFLLPLSLPPWALETPIRQVSWQGVPLQLLQVARFTEKKGISTTLEAVARARADGIDVKLVLAGDGPLRDPLVAQVASLGLGDHVEFLGMRPHSELPSLLDSTHVFVHPSRTATDGDTEGGYPTILVEAQARGVPVVATFHADIPSVVVNGKTGLLAQEGDAEGVARHLATLSGDRARLELMASEARTHALSRHDPGEVLRIQERIYENALAGGQ
jgi:colanic acid/amylovoran biosynthesis glycosyltransferase